MPYDHPVQRTRITFADSDPLAGLVMVVRGATVGDYVRIGGLATGELTPNRVQSLCEAMGPMLIEWDLSVGGQPVPADTDGMLSLEVPLAVRLTKEWLSAVAQVAAPLGQPSSDGATFPEGSIPMAARSASPPISIESSG